MYYLPSIEKIIYKCLKALNLKYRTKDFKRLNDGKLKTLQKQKHITNALQLILKTFSLESKNDLYQIIYTIYHSYIDLYLTMDHYLLENKKQVDFSFVVNYFIPTIVVFIDEFLKTTSLKLKDILPSENSIIFNVIQLYMDENSISTFDELAKNIDGSYQANIKQIQRIKLNKNIPKNNNFYKKFPKKYLPLFQLSSLLETFYQESDMVFSKDITLQIKKHFLDLYNKSMDKRSYDIYMGSNVIENIDETMRKSFKSLRIIHNWDTHVANNSNESYKLINQLDELCKKPKDLKIKQKIDELLQKLKKRKSASMFYTLFYARDLFYEQKFEESLTYYKQAIEFFKYKHKNNMLQILDEILTLLVIVDKTVVFGKYFDMLLEYQPLLYTQHQYFMLKKTSLFTSMNENMFYTRFKTSYQFNLLLTQLDEIEIDYENPNKIIHTKEYHRDLTQLMYVISSYKASQTKYIIIKKLLDSGADVNKKAGDNSTALLRAVQSLTKNEWSEKIVFLLLEHENISKTINDATKMSHTTVLLETLKIANLKLLKKILPFIDLELNNKLNKFPILYQLLIIYKKSDEKVIYEQLKLLIEYGAKLNFSVIVGAIEHEKWEFTPLMYACQIGAKSIIELFLSSGADAYYALAHTMTAQDILKIYHPELIAWFEQKVLEFS